QGRYTDAEPLYQRSLVIFEQMLGPSHPNVGRILNNLAELYRVQGRYTDAEPLYQRSLVVFKQSLGPAHPNVAQTLSNLAELSFQQSKWQEAARYWQESINVTIKRSRRDVNTAKYRVNSRSGSEIEQLTLRFRGLIKASYRV